MAEKRMFSKKIIDTDWFMDMPATTQNLYFHLSMRADDDGFIASPKRIIKLIGASEDDYKILISKKFIIPFESGVCVITDWRINNYLRNDRYTETIYQEEKQRLVLNENGKYEFGIPNGIPSINTDTNSNSISYTNIEEKETEKEKEKRFAKPSLEEVQAYCKERNNNVDAERFINFYTSKGWKVGNQPMKDWKACVRTWERENRQKPKDNFIQHEYSKQDFDNLFDNLDNVKVV